MKHPTISALIEPRCERRVALSFRNNGDRVAHLYCPNACLEGTIDNNVFVVHEGKAPIAYTWRYVKRPAPRPQDFVALPPHGSSVVEVDLSSAYALVAGGSYLVYYEAFHDDPAGSDALWEVTSNTVGLAG